MAANAAYLRCIIPSCGATLDFADTTFRCPKCGSLTDVEYDWRRLRLPKALREFDAKDRIGRIGNPSYSGVWRFHELLPFAPIEQAVTIGEGQTLLQPADALAQSIGLNSGRLFLHYEGLNPSGSFKDNGMCAAFTHARMVGARRAACASTGNTSASLALYCAATRLLRGVVFIGSGKISYGKLAQALDHGALTIQIDGDFDDAMLRVKQVAKELGIYLVNSINPFRLEGQKTIMFRVLEALDWEAPDWIVVPGGNLGNVSSFGKAFSELFDLGLIERKPRFAVINAAGADTLFQLVERRGVHWNAGKPDQFAIDSYYNDMDAEHRKAATIASAIEINRPVNLLKAVRALEWCGGVVRTVSDQEILDAKAQVGANGLGCEPASAASVAGLRRLIAEQVIGRDERVVCILTGHALKDSSATVAYHGSDQETFADVLGKRGIQMAHFANCPIAVPNELSAIIRVIEAHHES